MKKIIEGNIVFPDHIQYGQLIISDEVITEIKIDQTDFDKPDFLIEKSNFIAAGFIDIQINGAFGKEFKTDEDAIEIISNCIYKFGTTSFCPTVTTSEFRKYQTHTKKLLDIYNFNGQTKVIGLHLEGPMLNAKKVGAQNNTLLKQPSDIDFDSYISSSPRIVTFSPELEGSDELISKLIQNKIKIGIGHSIISYENLLEIYDDKNMMIVHLFNAMEALSSREPGLVGCGLANDSFTISLIADGIHVHPSIVKIIWESKQDKSKIICISDGSAVTGLENGVYQIGERTIQKSDKTATLPNGTLVGSILTLNVAIRNMLKYCNCNLYEAINTVTLNPAKYLGIENEIGQIKKDNKADLVIINSNIDVEMTFINGKLKYNKNQNE